ncbi:MAG: hypothetical protein ABSH33_07040 [Steroidobacteraceae bacterium]
MNDRMDRGLGRARWTLSVYAAPVVAIAVLLPALVRADSVLPVADEGNLYLSQSWVSTAPDQTPTTVTGTGVPGPAAPGQSLVDVSNLTGNGNSTGNYLFSQSFTNPSGSFAAATGPLSNGDTFGFISSYVIDVSASTAGAYLFSLNLDSSTGLENLSARLYEYSANGLQNLTLGVTGAVNTDLAATWTASSNGYVASSTLAPVNLAGGEYVLEVAGLEQGTTSGAYEGQLSISPVPLPHALPLLLSGCAALAGFVRLRKRS